MRYRPFAHFNASLSAVSLVLGDEGGPRPVDEWVSLLYAALECGVNSFEIEGRSPAIVDGLNRALQFVERRLVFISWRIGPAALPEAFASTAFCPETLQGAVRSLLARTRLEYLDLVLLDDPGVDALPPQSLALLRRMKSEGQVRFFGVAGQGEAIDAYISTGAFDALAIPYNMSSGWLERIRLRAAQAHNMAVIGYDFCPAHLKASPEDPARRRFWERKPTARAHAGPYDFLHRTPNWTAEEICLAYALTEPALVTVQIAASDIDQLQTLAGATERQMPPGLAPQIEMARINAGTGAIPVAKEA